MTGVHASGLAGSAHGRLVFERKPGVLAAQVGGDRLRRGDGLEVDVHLLADVDVHRPILGQLVDDLQDALIDPLGVVAGQALLGDDVGLDIDELESRSGPWDGP